jgi:hypothetical protein
MQLNCSDQSPCYVLTLNALNVCAPTEKKSDDNKWQFYEKSEQVFDHLPTFHIKILLGHFNANLGGRIISNRQLEKRFYIRIVMTMVFQYVPNSKIFTNKPATFLIKNYQIDRVLELYHAWRHGHKKSTQGERVTWNPNPSQIKYGKKIH